MPYLDSKTKESECSNLGNITKAVPYLDSNIVTNTHVVSEVS